MIDLDQLRKSWEWAEEISLPGDRYADAVAQITRSFTNDDIVAVATVKPPIPTISAVATAMGARRGLFTLKFQVQ